MDLQQPFLSELLHSTSNYINHKKFIFSLQTPQRHNYCLQYKQLKKKKRGCYAIAENLGAEVVDGDQSVILKNSRLEELMSKAFIISFNDRTDFTAKREEAGVLFFEVTERNNRGFAGWWGKEKDQGKANYTPNFLRFEAPCVLHNSREIVDDNGEKHYFSGLFLCRPSGQGKSMLIVRFGNTRKRTGLLKFIPNWFLHQNASKVLEQDMGFLSSQNEILMKEKVPTKKLYLNLRSSDTWVAEYRKWMDKVGNGMSYHFGHSTILLPQQPAVVEHAPDGFVVNFSAAQPAKGGIGGMYAPNPANRHFRHVVHRKDCRNVVKSFSDLEKGPHCYCSRVKCICNSSVRKTVEGPIFVFDNAMFSWSICLLDSHCNEYNQLHKDLQKIVNIKFPEFIGLFSMFSFHFSFCCCDSPS